MINKIIKNQWIRVQQYYFYKKNVNLQIKIKEEILLNKTLCHPIEINLSILLGLIKLSDKQATLNKSNKIIYKERIIIKLIKIVV
jgi:hypothetical protein